MRDERSLLQRSGLAWLTAALALTGAGRASAQECGPETCGPGLICATSQGTTCFCSGGGFGDAGPRDAGAVMTDAGTSASDPGSATTPVPGTPPGKEDAGIWQDGGGCEIVCTPYEYHYCTAAPCTTNSDCPSSMVCHAQSWYDCSGGCKPGTECAADAGSPDGGYACTEHTSSYCAERYNVPCRVDEDCGPGFDCNRNPYTMCSGGGSVTPGADGGWVFVDAGSECTTVTPETGWCSLQELPCASDTECPDTMTCQQQYEYPPCVPVWDASVVPVPGPGTLPDGGVTRPSDPDKDAGSRPTWECPPPVVSHVCRPESWGGGGIVGGAVGGGGYPPPDGAADAGAPSQGGTPGGGGPAGSGGTAAGGSYAGGGTGGGAIGGPGSADAGTQNPGSGGGDEGEEDDDDHGHGHHGGSLLHKLLKRLLGSGGCSVAGESAHGNLAWLSALSVFMVARVRRRRS